MNPGDGISVLPINIGACSKMLILLGKTYLERLWCVWEELFTLFTLQQRAAGTGERISIVCMDYSTGLNFSYVIKQFDTIYQRILAIRYSSEKPVLVDDIDSRLLGGFADEN